MAARLAQALNLAKPNLQRYPEQMEDYQAYRRREMLGYRFGRVPARGPESYLPKIKDRDELRAQMAASPTYIRFLKSHLLDLLQ